MRLWILICLTSYVATAQLKVSTDGHYLTEQDGTPVLLLSAAAWDFNNATLAKWQLYCDSAATHHINLVEIRMMGHSVFCGPANIYGVNPWQGSQTFASTPTEAFWLHVDSLIDIAATKGIYCNLYPDYLNAYGGTPNYNTETVNSSAAVMKAWGTYVGNRYKNKANVIWTIGGDLNPTSGVQTKLDSLVVGIIASGDTHLMSSREDQGTTSDDYWSTAAWHKIGGIYPYWNTYISERIYAWGYDQYNRTPIKPSRLQEAWYENEHATTSQHQLLMQTWYPMLSGLLVGTNFGHCPVYRYGCATSCDVSETWEDKLNTQGYQNMTHLYDVMHGRNWWKLVPDTSNVVADSGYGTFGGQTYVTTAHASDSSWLISYMPTAHNIRIKLTFVKGDSVTCSWFNPTTGAITALGKKARASTTFSAPFADAVFIADSFTNSTPRAPFVRR